VYDAVIQSTPLGMYDLVSLGPDACLSDTSAACRYWHLKCRVLRGANVTPDELRFVGFAQECPDRGGWRNAATSLGILYHDDREELSSEDSAMLSALMSIDDVTQGMIGFLH
jgi:hypothetical protein